LRATLTSIERIDPSAARMQELFDAGFYALQELARSVEDYAASVELDPARQRHQHRHALGERLLEFLGALYTV